MILSSKARVIFFLFFIISLAALVSGIYSISNNPKIGFVRSSDLFNGYHGTISARSEFQNRLSFRKAQVDSIKSARELYLTRIKESIDEEERKELITLIRIYDQNIAKAEANFENEVRADDSALLTPIMNQVNRAVEDFAEAEGYDIILGSTSDGALLFGTDAMDVTDQILVKLNNDE